MSLGVTDCRPQRRRFFAQRQGERIPQKAASMSKVLPVSESVLELVDVSAPMKDIVQSESHVPVGLIQRGTPSDSVTLMSCRVSMIFLKKLCCDCPHGRTLSSFLNFCLRAWSNLFWCSTLMLEVSLWASTFKLTLVPVPMSIPDLSSVLSSPWWSQISPLCLTVCLKMLACPPIGFRSLFPQGLMRPA